ncbi:MAG: hypothetical protein U1E97_09150 [Alphaproteobacteria bacterium]
MRLAEAAGAALTGLDQFYGHILSADLLRNDRLWPYPILDHLALAGIIVDRQGGGSSTKDWVASPSRTKRLAG